jgi:hypothetical protein
MLPVYPLFDEREDENKELLFIALMFEPLNAPTLFSGVKY